MRLIEIKDIESIKFYKKTYYNELIEEFINSNMMCAEVKDFKCKNANICALGIRKALARMKVSNIECYSSHNRVIIKKVGFKNEHKD